MQSRIDSLVEIYNNNKGKYLFDEANTIEFDEKDNINISLVLAKGKYYIFIFLLEEGNLIYKGLYMQSNYNLNNEYDQLKEDMNNISCSEFIDKYYDVLISNEK